MPSYDLTKESGHARQKIFEFCAKSGSVASFGTGPTKKSAKKSAAMFLMNKLKASASATTNESTEISAEVAEQLERKFLVER